MSSCQTVQERSSPKRLSRAEWEKAVDQLVTGRSVRAVGRSIGCSLETIRRTTRRATFEALSSRVSSLLATTQGRAAVLQQRTYEQLAKALENPSEKLLMWIAESHDVVPTPAKGRGRRAEQPAALVVSSSEFAEYQALGALEELEPA